MAVNRYVSSLVCFTLAISGGGLLAQSADSRDAWLMKNYRFTGPPPPGSIAPADPVVSELRQVQNMLLSIMRKADYGEDWEAALAAGEQAAAISQLIGVINERVNSASAATQEVAKSAASAPVYSIAFKDHTVEFAVAYWIAGPMLNYITRQGAHVQVRLDLVDRDETIKLNRLKNLEINLPQ
jgi:hypothetical protein